MFSNLLAEAEFIRKSWDYNMLEAIEFIYNHEEEYPSEIRRELKEFMSQGRKLFA